MSDILDRVHAFLTRFVAYPSDAAAVAHTLWTVHTHLMDCWESTPRIAFLSPEPGSGKTRALEITDLLVPSPVEAVNVTPAYLFRKVGDDGGKPTILYDEIDTIFGPKAKDNEEIRGLLNAGHRRGAVAGRCVVRGRNVTTEEIPAYCAVALAGLGDLPDTLLSRSIVIRMRRRRPDETVEPYRRRVHADEGDRLRFALEDWAAGHAPNIEGVWPDMPAGIEDRDADVWEPLLAIADEVGGEWPERARVAAVTLVTDSKDSTPSLGVKLLSDLRDVFGDHDGMTTEAILKALGQIEESPWNDLYGKALNARGLSQRVGRYGVKSKTIRIGEVVAKGYRREDLHDAWNRYLPLQMPQKVTNVTDEDDAKPKVNVNVNYSNLLEGIEEGEEPNPSPDKSVTSVTSVTRTPADDFWDAPTRLPGTDPHQRCHVCDQNGYLEIINGLPMHPRCAPKEPTTEEIAGI